MTAKKLDQSVQTYSGQQTPGNMKVPDMTVSLFKDGQNQVFSLPGYLASSLFHSTAKPVTWQSYGHLPKNTETKLLDILSLRRFQERGMSSVLLKALFVQCTSFPQHPKIADLLFRIWWMAMLTIASSV
jgi:hypothetical protein